MPDIEPTANYISLAAADRYRSQAWKVWTIGLVVVALWVGVIVVAPVANANGFTTISSPLYYFFSFICHQTSQRSFHIAGEQFAVCTRCFGVYFGLLFGFAVYPLWRNIDDIDPLRRFWLFLSLIPILIDWALTFFEIWENTQLSRFITGMIVGVACATFIVPALVEITRNLTYRRQ